jgi:hypothetical protein
MKTKSHSVLLPLGLMLASGLANASIIITQGPSSAGALENILFNDPNLQNNSTVVQGVSNQANFRVNFTGTEILVTQGGQSRLEAQDGAFDSLAIALTSGALFTNLVFNIHAASDGTVTINANPFGGSPVSQTFVIDGGGQNFFRVSAMAGDRLTGVNFTASVDMEDVRQVRVGGVVPNALIPEPSTYIMLGTALAALGWSGRRRVVELRDFERRES